MTVSLYSVSDFNPADAAFLPLMDLIRTRDEQSWTAADRRAATHAEEFGLGAPDPCMTGLVSTLVASAPEDGQFSAVIASENAASFGLAVARATDSVHLTCIAPEQEHLNHAREVFRDAQLPASAVRFIPNQPLAVLNRLAKNNYRLIVGEIRPLDLPSFVESTWPLLRTGGSLLLVGSLLDGTIQDETRKDRDTVAAREALTELSNREDATVALFPFGSGLVVATKR